MLLYSTNESIQYEGVHALYRLAKHGVWIGKEHFLPSCLPYILSAMNEFPESARVNEYCCGVLSSIVTPATLSRQFTSTTTTNLITLLVQTIIKHSSTFGVVNRGCGCLCNIAMYSSDLKREISRTNNIGDFLQSQKKVDNIKVLLGHLYN